MNDEDQKAFEQWFKTEFKREIDSTRSYSYEEGIFDFACQHKQDEIDKLNKINDHLVNQLMYALELKESEDK